MTKVTVTTLADTTPPVYTATYPRAVDVTDETMKVVVSLDEPGSVTAVVSPDGSSTQLATITWAVSTAETVTTSPIISGLQATTAYDVYVLAQDDEPTPNVQATSTKLDVSTGADVTAPIRTAGYPTITNVQDTSVTMNTQLNEVGVEYFVVIPAAATTPSVSQVKAGADATGSAALVSGSASILQSLSTTSTVLDGLTAATQYKVCVVAEDGEPTPNIST